MLEAVSVVRWMVTNPRWTCSPTAVPGHPLLTEQLHSSWKELAGLCFYPYFWTPDVGMRFPSQKTKAHFMAFFPGVKLYQSQLKNLDSTEVLILDRNVACLLLSWLIILNNTYSFTVRLTKKWNNSWEIICGLINGEACGKLSTKNEIS